MASLSSCVLRLLIALSHLISLVSSISWWRGSRLSCWLVVIINSEVRFLGLLLLGRHNEFLFASDCCLWRCWSILNGSLRATIFMSNSCCLDEHFRFFGNCWVNFLKLTRWWWNCSGLENKFWFIFKVSNHARPRFIVNGIRLLWRLF